MIVMSTSKHFDAIVAVVLALGLLLTVGFINGEALGIEKIVDEDAEGYEATEYFTTNDLTGDWDASNPTATITLNGDSAQLSQDFFGKKDQTDNINKGKPGNTTNEEYKSILGLLDSFRPKKEEEKSKQ